MDVEIIVEIPQSSRNKYEMDHASGRIRLDRMLFTSARYPLDCGFIPDTLAEDGNPLDAMILHGEPASPGCSVTARPVGVFWMHDEHGPDAKILIVPARDPQYADIQDLGDVSGHQLGEITQFLDTYKQREPGKNTDVSGWQDRAAAEHVIAAAFTRARWAVPAGPAIRLFGTGRAARVAATHASDELRADGVAAAALFKPGLGGWIVQIFPGGIRGFTRRGADGRR
ncbi:MAG TPA: inorganic diphosphatase [Streptosporangiaceae bacterium]|nr:inorganic diphosphatase [Streptosporangiaceae bacterium]